MACDSYTVLMLHCDGTDASTSFPDSSASNHTVTANGDAQVDTAQSKFGGASALFDGVGDNLSAGDSDDWDFAGDYTIDFWVRIHTNADYGICQVGLGYPTAGIGIRSTTNQGSNWQVYINGGALFNVGSIPTTDTWFHFALVRSGTGTNNTVLYIDGTSIGQTTNTSDTTGSTVGVKIGKWDGGGGDYAGWIDEFRVSKGIARWTANFTPPTSAYCPASSSLFVPRMMLMGVG